jgi:molecular chaperone DnaK
MRDTVDFGIDLGTTNSVIAVFEGGDVRVIKNFEGSECTPSAVWMPEPGVVHVGRVAAARAASDPDDAAAEFKLDMGLAGTERRFRSAGVSLSPPQLSAEVLKSLRADAAEIYGAPATAVITVPAAFMLNQNSATGEAAQLAGLGAKCPLLQEPSATAYAYGLADRSDRAYWLVFDLGGGTFDAAVVCKRDGMLLVVNHAGDPNLGGKLIDWAIVDQLLAPIAARELGVADFRRGDPRYRAHFAALKAAAEEAKIQLSRQQRVIASPTLRIDRGRSIELECPITRDEVDRIAEPYYVKAIDHCRRALSEGNLGPDDIDRLLLVGGVTLAPGLRERLADDRAGLGIELDHSQDPRTVVAQGAAIFARTIPVDAPTVRPAPNAFSVELRYPRVTEDAQPVVRGTLHSAEPVRWADYRIRFTNPDSRPPFHGPQVEVRENGTFVAELFVPTRDQRTSQFAIELTDGTGTPRTLTPDSMSISYGPEVGPPTLTYSLGIGQSDYQLARVLAKGATLPARETRTFETTVPLSRTDANSVIRIPVYEGEHYRADRNPPVAMLRIRPGDVQVDLPVGTEIEITIRVDRNRRVEVVADVPILRTQFEAEVDLDNTTAPDEADLAALVDEVEARTARLHTAARIAGDAETLQRLDQLVTSEELDTVRDELADRPVAAATAASCHRRLLEIQATLDDAEQSVDLPEQLNAARETLDRCRDLAEQTGDIGAHAELADLEQRLARAGTDARVVSSVHDRAAAVELDILRRLPDWDLVLFEAFQVNQHKLRPADQADRLIREGEQYVAAGDLAEVHAVNEQLRRLWPPDERLPAAGPGDVTLRGQ